MAQLVWCKKTNKAVPVGTEVKKSEVVVSTSETLPDIDELKAKADALGISYSPNIGEAKLRERIERHEKE